MHGSLEFFVGLLDEDEPCIASEDRSGERGHLIDLCEEMGFLCGGPGINPVANCPHCLEGVPYRLHDRAVCPVCRSVVEETHLLLWPLDREAVLRWLASLLSLRGEVRGIDARLWQLGTLCAEGERYECFFRRQGPLSEAARQRLSAFRNVLLLFGLSPPPEDERRRGHCVSLLELLSLAAGLAVRDVSALLRPRGGVRFDPGTGALWVGDDCLGEVPVGSKEFSFLACLARQLDTFVAYADLKLAVLQASGSRDATEEATFCQGLKSRIKKKWITRIDQLIVTTNKGDGYRLRGHIERDGARR